VSFDFQDNLKDRRHTQDLQWGGRFTGGGSRNFLKGDRVMGLGD